MTAVWYILDPVMLPHAAVVIDASPAASALWNGPIASILEEIADRTPADARPEVVFLGGRTLHPLGGVLRGLDSSHPTATGPGVDIAANLGRYPVAGPILRDLLDGPPRPVLLLLNGPLLDGDDWAAPEVTRHVLVYRLTGAGRVSPPAFRELGPGADLGDLVAHLSDPVRAVRVSGFALEWDNDAYRWEDGELAADEPATAAVRVRLAAADGAAPEAVATRAGGAEHRLRLVVGRGPVPPEPVPLTPAEATVFDLWERGQGYYCGACRRTHGPGRVRCQPPADGPPLLPTVEGLAAPLVTADRASGGWAVRPVPRGVLPLPDGRMLVRRPRAASCYALDGGRWVPFDDPGDWVPLGDGAVAVGG